jgi:hypothetical protein
MRTKTNTDSIASDEQRPQVTICGGSVADDATEQAGDEASSGRKTMRRQDIDAGLSPSSG